MKKEKKELDRRALYRKYRIIGILQNIGIVLIVIAVMAGGAFGIYYLKNDYDRDMAEFRSSLSAEASSREAVEASWKASVAANTTTQQPTSAEQPSTQHMMANAGGELDTSLTDQEKGYQEYVEVQESTTVKEKDTTAALTEPVTTKKEAVTTEAPSTTVKPTEAPTTTPPETITKERETTPAPTTAAVVEETTVRQSANEMLREAMLQLGYDLDNYIASNLTKTEKTELIKQITQLPWYKSLPTSEKTAIGRVLLGRSGETASPPAEHIIYETVDWSNYDSKYSDEFRATLPKPMG